jgi:hypothetical protein
MTQQTQCTECGNEINSTAKFCMHCGAEQAIHAAEAPPPQVVHSESFNPLFIGSAGDKVDDLDLSDEEKDYWEDKAGPATSRAIGWLLKAIKVKMPAGLACSAGKVYISIVPVGQTRRTDFVIYPLKKSIVFSVRLPDSDQLQQALQSIGATPMSFDEKNGRSRFSIAPGNVGSSEGLLLELLAAAFAGKGAQSGASVAHSVAPKAQNPGTDDKRKNAMRLTNVLKDWLKAKEWEEQPEIDEENQASSTGFGFTVEDFSLQCWFEIYEKAEIFKLFMYFWDTKVPENRLDEVQKYVTALSNALRIGSLQLLRDDRVIRYCAGIDVEDASFEPAHINNLLNAGARVLEEALPKYMAICFGGKTAEEILAEQ